MSFNLLHAHGSPTHYPYKHHGCRCIACRAARAAYDASYCAAHRQEIAAYRAAHREEIAAYCAAHREDKAAYDAVYKAARREEALAYRAVHRAEIAATKRAYQLSHREEINAAVRRRRSRKRGNLGSHTATDVRAQYERQRGRCYYCGVEVAETYHVDHAVPLSKGGSNGPENLVIACPHCNLSKNDKLPHEFAGRLC